MHPAEPVERPSPRRTAPEPPAEALSLIPAALFGSPATDSREEKELEGGARKRRRWVSERG